MYPPNDLIAISQIQQTTRCNLVCFKDILSTYPDSKSVSAMKSSPFSKTLAILLVSVPMAFFTITEYLPESIPEKDAILKTESTAPGIKILFLYH